MRLRDPVNSYPSNPAQPPKPPDTSYERLNSLPDAGPAPVGTDNVSDVFVRVRHVSRAAQITQCTAISIAFERATPKGAPGSSSVRLCPNWSSGRVPFVRLRLGRLDQLQHGGETGFRAWLYNAAARAVDGA